MRNEVTVVPMSRDIMDIPTLTSKPNVTWTNENASKSTTTASFGQKTLTVYKMAAIQYMSDELIADTDTVDVVDFIVDLFSEAIGEEEDRVIAQGSGSGEPTGLTNGGINSVKTVSGNLGFDDLIDLIHGLPNSYHSNAKFYAHQNNINELRKLKDNEGRYLWNESTAPDQPSTFHGFPVVELNKLPESEIYFGDLEMTYWLGDRQRMTVKTSRDTTQAFTQDQTAVRVVSRIAGNVVRSDATRKIDGIP